MLAIKLHINTNHYVIQSQHHHYISKRIITRNSLN